MEPEFRKPTLEESEFIKEVLKKNHYRGCELSTPNLILWADYYHMEYTIIDGVLISRNIDEQGRIRLSYPIGAVGEEEERRFFDLELRYFREQGQSPMFGIIDPVMWKQINRWYPGRFEICYERDWADYVYSREKLTTLAGKKLHGKRNHIKRFQDNHPEWSYETITDANVEECLKMAKMWCKANCVAEDDEKEEEYHLVVRALRNREALGMRGGLLRIPEGVIAFTLGAPVTEDTFDVCFERALGDIQGAYPMINQQFVLHELQSYTYINREEDVGVEGLRKAKLSYYPEYLLEKGIVRESTSFTCLSSLSGI